MLSVHLKRPRTLRLLALIAFCAALAATHATPAFAADTPVAAFSTSPSTPDVGHPATFDASASSDPGGEAITRYQWSFGDGVTQTSSTALTTHVYAAPGSYTVVLTVQDTGGTTSAAVSHVVKVAPDVPIAKFSLSPVSAFIGKTVKLNGSGSNDPDGDAIVSYRWNFGDGSTQTTSTPSVSHVYPFAGTFTATLTAIDSHSNPSAPTSHTVSISAPPPVLGPPLAQFKFSPADPAAGQLVTFDASSSTDPGGTIKSFRWTFGDHASATTSIAAVRHAYGHTGNYTVALVVLDSRGEHSKTAIRKVTVTVPPKPRISTLHVRMCARKSKHCPKTGLYVSFELSVRDRVVLTITPRNHRRPVKRVVITSRSGTSAHRIRFAHIRSGRYVLHVRPAGGAAASARFSWHAA